MSSCGSEECRRTARLSPWTLLICSGPCARSFRRARAQRRRPIAHGSAAVKLSSLALPSALPYPTLAIRPSAERIPARQPECQDSASCLPVRKTRCFRNPMLLPAALPDLGPTRLGRPSSARTGPEQPAALSQHVPLPSRTDSRHRRRLGNMSGPARKRGWLFGG